MQEISLFLRLLAERVYTARLPTGRIIDASDFHEWLVEVSQVAERTDSPQEFFEQI